MSIKALLIRVPKLTTIITQITKAPEVIKGMRRTILGEQFPVVFTRVWINEDKTIAIYINPDNPIDAPPESESEEQDVFTESLEDA